MVAYPFPTTVDLRQPATLLDVRRFFCNDVVVVLTVWLTRKFVVVAAGKLLLLQFQFYVSFIFVVKHKVNTFFRFYICLYASRCIGYSSICNFLGFSLTANRQEMLLSSWSY